ncbi:cytochrome P450 [Mycolicibacter sp. MYC123]|uniref:Cytochrome P450 n=1 Tax=[Mycobacterium] zoologicum TaxID=2872311 RepID=A0ABU5YQI2_9MYCO|nr:MULTISPECIES: cytochrome P450 [unclassified Mycolicibacter]MEB3051985.1 cytochrome P450 [Mycolicibacter sp. MYC123]MEB3062929.1 cytochrome P450 [Mycolicibacter sp. MYC101]
MESQVDDVAAALDKPAGYIRNPYPYFEDKRRQAGIAPGTVMDYSKTPESLRPKTSFAAVSFEAVNQVFREADSFNSRIYDMTIGLFLGPTILAMEGEPHRKHRNLVSSAFKRKSLAHWEPAVVRPVCTALIDEFIEAGTADLVADFTFEFPTRVISKLLGLPEEDLAWFRQRAMELISYTVDFERAFTASTQLKDYFLAQMDKRKAHPTEDIIGDLVTAEVDGEKLTDEAIYSFLRLLLPAGLETTYRATGNLLYLLLTHPEQFAAVRADHDLIGAAIEEGLRYETPLTTVQRTAIRDTTVAGVSIPAGAVVDVCIGSANRDETRWERPEEFDIFRKWIPHITFAAGEHTCMGLHLARMEMRVAMECLLDRLGEIALITDDDPHIYGQPFRSPRRLPVTFSAKG